MSHKNYLIIPAAGKSSRYPTNKPKWLLTHPHGKLMIEEVVSGLRLDDYDECHIVILKEHCENHDADTIIQQCFDDKFKVTILDQPTNSSPESVVRCIEQNNLDGQITVKDSDCYVEFEKSQYQNFIVGLNVNNKLIKKLDSKSFVKIADGGVLQTIVEKKVISDTICVGVYSMQSSELLKRFRELNAYTDKEVYFSHIVSLMIEKGTIFGVTKCEKFIDWGTSDEWFDYTSNLRTYIFDIDGVFLQNRGRYGLENWSNTFLPIQDNLDVLKRLSDAGSEIIFMTSRDEEYLHEFKNLLRDSSIKYKTIISGCNHNKRIIVNDFASTNPYPSCESINIPRNGQLGDYI